MIVSPLRVRQTLSTLASDTFRSLHHRNYRLFFSGQAVSLIGTWLENTAFAWLVYSLTKNSLALGIMGFLGSIPVLLLSVVAGTIADEHPKRKILVITQAASGGISIALAAYLWTGNESIIVIGLARLALGVVTAFDNPTRQAFVVEIASKDDVTNAVALNSAAFNSARLLGPAVAGYVIATLSMTMCFFLNGLSFGAVIIGLLMMRFDHVITHKRPKEESRLHAIKVGVHYLAAIPQLKALMLLIVSMTIFGWGYTINLPVVAGQILHGGASVYSALLSSNGVGALIAALSQAAFAGKLEARKMAFIAISVFIASLIIIAFSTTLVATCFALVLTGWGIITFFITANTTLQRRVPDVLRGRVMGIYALSFMGLFPFGSLWAGYLADLFGVAEAFLVNAILLIACAVPAYLYLRKLPHITDDQIQAVRAQLAVEEPLLLQEQI